MKFAVFAYDFPHWKTMMGLLSMKVNGFVPSLVVAAPRKELNIRQSKPIGMEGLYLEHPRDICRAFGFPYVVSPHELTGFRGMDFGVILGARILPKEVIRQFRLGIINLHPGILPKNRGLDNVKWAIKKMIPQGVTAHWINEHVDSGEKISVSFVKVFRHDCIRDVQFRVQNAEIDLLPIVMSDVLNGTNVDGVMLPADNNTQKCLTPEEEATLDSEFEQYKRRFCV